MDLSELAGIGRQILNFQLFTISGTTVTAMDLVVFSVIVTATWMVSRFLRRAILGAFRTRDIDPGTEAVIVRLSHYSIMAIGIAWGLSNVGINLGALFAAGAVFAVGIGFAMQNIAQNFVSGMILIVERAIKPNDVLEVDGRVVRVVQMGIRTTIARTRDEEELIIPNSTLVQSTVKNYTLQDSLYRVRALVGVAYASDMDEVKRTLDTVGERIDWRVVSQEPVSLLRDFGSSSVNWELSVWVQDPWRAPGFSSELRHAMWDALADAGITIAFPQVDVHFDPVVEDSLQRLPRAS